MFGELGGKLYVCMVKKFPDRNSSSLFRLYNVLDYVAMFKDDILNTCTSSKDVTNMFQECFEIICFFMQLTLSDRE